MRIYLRDAADQGWAEVSSSYLPTARPERGCPAVELNITGGRLLTPAMARELHDALGLVLEHLPRR